MVDACPALLLFIADVGKFIWVFQLPVRKSDANVQAQLLAIVQIEFGVFFDCIQRLQEFRNLLDWFGKQGSITKQASNLNSLIT